MTSNEQSPDPSEQSIWRPLRRLQEAMDADIGRVYDQAGIDAVKPSQVMELLRLAARGPMSIADLAVSVERTHSATSQKVAAMRTAGLVRTKPGRDARTRMVVLTAKAQRIIPRLAAEWRATEAAVAEIESEIPYPLSTVVADIEVALTRQAFRDRIARHLTLDPDWPSE
jgi:DNA-binding MarR family transcriptional regulator